MKFKEFLYESMTMYVQGYKSPEAFHNMGDLSYYLSEKITKNIPHDKLKGFIPYQTITPDGTEIHKTSGIMNFYQHELSDESMELITRALKYFMDEVKVKYGPFKKDISKMTNTPVIRIPILHIPNDKEDRPLEINMSNRNADHIFREILGYQDFSSDYTFSARDLLMKLNSASTQFNSQTKDIPGRKEKNQFHMPLTTEDIMIRMKYIENFVKWVIDHGYDEIYMA